MSSDFVELDDGGLPLHLALSLLCFFLHLALLDLLEDFQADVREGLDDLGEALDEVLLARNLLLFLRDRLV